MPSRACQSFALACMAFLPAWSSGQAPTTAPAPSEARFTVGAIRWDGWFGTPNAVGRAVHDTLADPKWHHRLPFFAEIAADGVHIDGSSQATVDREIAFAASAGLNYWAFVTYAADDPLSLGLERYLSSRARSQLQFCLVTEFSRWRNPKFVERVEHLIAEPGYQTVLGHRPLLYLGFLDSAAMEKFPGGQAGFVRTLEAFRANLQRRGLARPYMVIMDWNADEAARWARGLDCDAVSSYATGQEQRTIHYARLARNAERFWDTGAAAGAQVVPIVMTGWDRRPRVEKPVPWERSQKQGEGMEHYVTAGTPDEIAAHLQRAISWMAAHSSQAPARAAIIYAWNEFDEGGWLCPTRGEGNARLAAIRRVLRATETATAPGDGPADAR